MGVNGTHLGVLLEGQHDLRRTVPTRRDVFRHERRIFVWSGVESPGQSKVADLQFAVGVDEQVAGFEVTVEDVGAVDVFETAEGLVDEGLKVGVGEGLA